MTRQSSSLRRRARRRGPRRGRAARHPRVAARAAPDPRARPPGRPRGDAAGRPAARPQADEGGPRPVGLDHALPGRQARRRRARDPDAGLRPDLDPAAGRQGPGRGRADHRQDRPARALRPRGRPRLALDRRAHAGSRSRRRSSTTCSRASRHSPRRARPTPTTSSARRGRRSSAARSDEEGGAREVGRQASHRVTSCSPCRPTRSWSAAAPARSCARRRPGEPDERRPGT